MHVSDGPSHSLTLFVSYVPSQNILLRQWHALQALLENVHALLSLLEVLGTNHCDVATTRLTLAFSTFWGDGGMTDGASSQKMNRISIFSAHYFQNDRPLPSQRLGLFGARKASPTNKTAPQRRFFPVFWLWWRVQCYRGICYRYSNDSHCSHWVFQNGPNLCVEEKSKRHGCHRVTWWQVSTQNTKVDSRETQTRYIGTIRNLTRHNGKYLQHCELWWQATRIGHKCEWQNSPPLNPFRKWQ